MASLCVYCGSNTGEDPAYARAASALAQSLVAHGHDLVYGGGDVGLMKIVADTVLAGGRAVTGVMTEQLVALEVAHHGLTTLDVQPTMHARKARMAELADGVLVLPGGFGTWEEAFEILTWNQLGLASMPVVFINVNEFYRPLFDFLDQAMAAGFVSPHNAGFAMRADDPAQAVELAAGPAPSYQAKWVN